MTPINKSTLLALNSVRSSYGQIHKTKQGAITFLKQFKIAAIELQTGLHDSIAAIELHEDAAF